jgi:hypothetical protein
MPDVEQPTEARDRRASQGGAVADFFRRQRRTIIAAAMVFAGMLVYLLNRARKDDPVPEFLLALTAAMAVHLLDRLWLHKEAEESFDQLQKQIVDNVARETQKSIQTLAAMNRSGVLRVYANRDQAASDIQQSLTSQHTENIRLIGISLNDFVLGKEKQALGRTWSLLKRGIENGIEPNRNLDIKVLIIDPTCLGAQLRSKGEERDQALRIQERIFAGRRQGNCSIGDKECLH